MAFSKLRDKLGLPNQDIQQNEPDLANTILKNKLQLYAGLMGLSDSPQEKESDDAIEPIQSPIDVLAGIGGSGLAQKLAPAIERHVGNEIGAIGDLKKGKSFSNINKSLSNAPIEVEEFAPTTSFINPGVVEKLKDPGNVKNFRSMVKQYEAIGEKYDPHLDRSYLDHTKPEYNELLQQLERAKGGL